MVTSRRTERLEKKSDMAIDVKSNAKTIESSVNPAEPLQNNKKAAKTIVAIKVAWLLPIERLGEG